MTYFSKTDEKVLLIAVPQGLAGLGPSALFVFSGVRHVCGLDSVCSVVKHLHERWGVRGLSHRTQSRQEVKCKTPLVVCSDAFPWRGKVAAGVWAAPAVERAARSCGTFGMRLQVVNAAVNAPRLWAPSAEVP